MNIANTSVTLLESILFICILTFCFVVLATGILFSQLCWAWHQAGKN